MRRTDGKTIMKIDQASMMNGLDWAYDQAVNGIPFLKSAEDLGNEYKQAHTAGTDSLDACARRLVRWQMSKAGTSGFLSGIGGVLTLPVAIPANLNDQVRTLCYACMCGSASADVLKNVGIKLGAKLTEQAIKQITGQVITHINRAVGFRLVTKFGQKGLINFGKMVPLIGGVVGGTFDATSTHVVGTIARTIFIETSATAEG